MDTTAVSEPAVAGFVENVTVIEVAVAAVTSPIAPLLKVTVLFALAAVAFAFATVGHLRERPWRWRAQGAAVTAFTLLVAAFWPS